jgi:KaiC/GvpD/RAD55 family RecA-like ATPase
MSDLTRNNINVTEIFKEKYAKLGKAWMTLLQVPIERSMEVNIEAIKVLQFLGHDGVYITLSKDYLELSKIFVKNGIDMGRLAFIDGISQMYRIEKIEAPNVTYVDGPLSIDAIARSVSEIVPKMKSEKKFVFLDSITSVLLYNSLERTLDFSRFLNVTLKQINATGIVVSVAKGFANDSLLKELTKISNEVINLQT